MIQREAGVGVACALPLLCSKALPEAKSSVLGTMANGKTARQRQAASCYSGFRAQKQMWP